MEGRRLLSTFWGNLKFEEKGRRRDNLDQAHVILQLAHVSPADSSALSRTAKECPVQKSFKPRVTEQVGDIWLICPEHTAGSSSQEELSSCSIVYQAITSGNLTCMQWLIQCSLFYGTNLFDSPFAIRETQATRSTWRGNLHGLKVLMKTLHIAYNQTSARFEELGGSA